MSADCGLRLGTVVLLPGVEIRVEAKVGGSLVINSVDSGQKKYIY